MTMGVFNDDEQANEGYRGKYMLNKIKRINQQYKCLYAQSNKGNDSIIRR